MIPLIVVAYMAFNVATVAKEAQYGARWQKCGLDLLFGFPIWLFGVIKKLFKK